MILSRYEWMIARRYLLPGKGEGFIFLVASISLVAVMLGVAALIIVMSVMNGFRAELIEKVVGLNGHAIIQGYGGRLDNWRPILEQARRTPGVTSASALIELPLMATNEGRVEAILLRGIPRDEILVQPDDEQQRHRRLAPRPHARQQQRRDRLAARRAARAFGRQLDHDHLAAGPHDAVRHGAKDRRLSRRRDLRGRPLRFRQGVRRHADRGRPELPDDGRFDRDDRGQYGRRRPGAGNPRADHRGGRRPRRRARLALDELGAVRGARRSSASSCSSCFRSSSSSRCSTSSPR